MSIFERVVDADILNPKFRTVADLPGYAPARKEMQRAYDWLPNPDPHFVREFQTQGFDARVWELYLCATFHDLSLDVARTHDRPDFELRQGGSTIYVEATTTNPSQEGDDSVRLFEKLDVADRIPRQHRLVREISKHLTIKLGSSLRSKLQRKYWDLPWVAGWPLIFAVAPFHHDQALGLSDSTLHQYLYGRRFEAERKKDGRIKYYVVPVRIHRYRGKKIPSAFFNHPEVEHISAVLYGNAGTIAKFNRMGYQRGGFEGRMTMIHVGNCYDPDPAALVPMSFRYVVGTRSPKERWSEGLVVFHNPNALHPIETELSSLPIAQCRLLDGWLDTSLPPFHPYASRTLVFNTDSAKPADRPHFT